MKKAMVAVTTLMLAASARATERRLTYTYESAVLAPGERELEPWTTWRVGREGFYSAFDERLEFEVGLTDRLQSSWYLNFGSVVEGPARDERFTFDGVSSEWKLKLTDPVADPVGSALYLEVRGAPDEAEIEGKLILDKRTGNLLAALNLVGAYAWDFAPGQVQHETELEAVGGLSYAISPSLAVGVEAQSHTDLAGGDVEASILSAGPVVSYAGPTWWAALTVLPQIVAVKGATNGLLDLADFERAQARIIFGWHL